MWQAASPRACYWFPILFVAFINDLPNPVESTTCLFADDTKLYRSIRGEEDRKTVQIDLNNMFDWGTKWLLKFHLDKCKVIRIRNKKKLVDTRSYTKESYQTPWEIVDSEKDIVSTLICI